MRIRCIKRSKLVNCYDLLRFVGLKYNSISYEIYLWGQINVQVRDQVIDRMCSGK